MAQPITLLGIPIHPETLASARERVISFIKAGVPARAIYSINPEIIMAARRDKRLYEILRHGSLNLPDGIGVVWGGRVNGDRILERVAGYDLMLVLLAVSAREGYRVFFLGGEPGVAAKARQTALQRHPSLQVVGTHHGYFNGEEVETVRQAILNSEPHILFVGMGFPRQERFIHRVAVPLGVPVSMAVGGSFDVMAGRVRRAPLLLQRLNLEWLFRIITGRRWQRLLVLPPFALLVIWERMMKTKPRREGNG